MTRAGTAGTRPSFKTLSGYITERFDAFSRSQKDVARYIVDHLDEAAFQTAEELARRANTSSSTVVRFSQALGFEGYPELQQAAIEEYRRRGSNGGGAIASPPLFSLEQSEFETALSTDHVNVEETARKLTREVIDSCVESFTLSSRALIVGVDQMAFFASYLRHLLALLDFRAEIVTNASQEALGKLARIDEKTLVIGLSAGRAQALVVRSMKIAKARSSRTIAICDATLSEVGKLADVKVYYSSNSPSYTRSHTALMGVVQALAYAVYAHDEAAYKDRIRAFKLK
jgi:DNA-binding MurR/RpiR family transcriptional regulator